MTPATIIRDAKAEGVGLSLSPSGKIKATGNGDAVNRWLAVIRECKAELIEALKVGAGDTAEPFDREAWEERAGIAEFDGGLTRSEAERLAWAEDDRRRCSQCQNYSRAGVCLIAEPKEGALVVARRGYRPVDILHRCKGFQPKGERT